MKKSIFLFLAIIAALIYILAPAILKADTRASPLVVSCSHFIGLPTSSNDSIVAFPTIGAPSKIGGYVVTVTPVIGGFDVTITFIESVRDIQDANVYQIEAAALVGMEIRFAKIMATNTFIDTIIHPMALVSSPLPVNLARGQQLKLPIQLQSAMVSAQNHLLDGNGHLRV